MNDVYAVGQRLDEGRPVVRSVRPRCLASLFPNMNLRLAKTNLRANQRNASRNRNGEDRSEAPIAQIVSLLRNADRPGKFARLSNS